MLIDRWMDKEVEYIYHGILSSHRKEWNNAICSNIQGPREYHLLSEVSQRDKDKKSYDIAFIWNQKRVIKWTYIQNRDWPTDTKQTYG